jgi:chromate reductase
MSDTVKVIGLSGSLRKASFNSALLRSALSVVPEGMTLELADDVGKLPHYDEDLHKQGFPAEVAAFRAKLAAADALLISSPEYNYSIPGALKNAIDWASRAPNQPFDKKTLAIMGASPGMLGTARMQYHLRQVAVFLNMRVVNKPEVFVARAPDKFDADGNLKDEATRKLVGDLLVALRDLTLQMRPR